MAFHKAIIVYCSPGGTTRHVAGVMMQQCQSLGIDVQEVDLARRPDMETIKVDLKMAAAHMPAREVDETACTACGQCVDDCPTDAITLAPVPVFGETCIYCYRCVRECPEEAIRADLSGVEARIRERVKQFDEQPLSQIFYVSEM